MNTKQLTWVNLSALPVLVLGWMALSSLDREGFPAWPFMTLLLIVVGMVTFVTWRLQGASVAVIATGVWATWFAISLLSGVLFNARFPTRLSYPMPQLVVFAVLFVWNAWTLHSAGQKADALKA